MTEAREHLIEMDVAAMLRDGVPKPVFDLQDLLIEKSFCYLTGEPKGSKTWLALAWTIAMVTGKSFAGLATRGDHRVLFVEAEQWSQIPLRLEPLCRGFAVDPYEVIKRVKFFRPNGRLRLEREEAAAELHARIKDFGATWTIIDSFVRIHGLDENSVRDMSLLAGVGLLPVSADCGSGLVMLDHPPKSIGGRQRRGGEQVRGAGEKLAAADCHLDVDSHRKEKTIEITVEVNRLAPERETPLHLRLSDTAGGMVFEPCDGPERSYGPAGRKTQAAISILTDARTTTPDLTWKQAVDLCTASGISRSTASDAYRSVFK